MSANNKTRREFMKTAGTSLACIGLLSSWHTCQAESPSAKTSASPLPMRTLGRTRLPVSLLGLGVGPVIDDTVYRRAFDLGIRYFHISFDKHSTQLPPGETFNKAALAALRPFRQDIVVSYMTTVRSTKDALLRDLDECLALSKFGHLDVWFVCCPSPALVNEFSEALAVARKAGKAHWGALSTHGLKAVMPQLTNPDSPFDVLMMTYNHTASKDDKKNLGALHKANLGITPMKPLAGRFYQQTSNDPGPLLRWLAADKRVHTIPVGMKTITQVEQNVAALRTSLSDQDRDVLQSQLAFTSSRFCRMCGTCDGRCARDLAISDLVRCAMYVEGYGDPAMARSHFTAIPITQRKIRCQDCIECTIRCPNGVAIRERMERAKELLS